MKIEDITADNLVNLIKDHAQFKELIADQAALEVVTRMRTSDDWDLFMLAALYQTAGRYADLISAVNGDVLNNAMSNVSDQNDHILILTLYFQGIENFKILKSKISPTVLGKILLFLAQQLMPDDFAQLVAAIGQESNVLMLSALSTHIPQVASRSSSIQLLSSNISLDILEKGAENHNAQFYEILNNLSALKLNELLKSISEKSTDSLRRILNGLNKHSVTKSVLVSERGNNLVMVMVENRKRSAVVSIWIDFLHEIGVLNRVAVKINQGNENLLMIALRHQESSMVEKLIALVHITVLHKTLLALLANGLGNAFTQLWDLLNGEKKGKVLIDVAKHATAIELNCFVNKVSNYMLEILLSVSDAEFIQLIEKIDPLQLADLLLKGKNSKEKLIYRWMELSYKSLLTVLKVKDDNNANIFMRLARSLNATEFSVLVKSLSEAGGLVELASEASDYGQDALMFSAYHQEAGSFLILAKSIQKENKLNDFAVRKDKNNFNVLLFLSQKNTSKILATFLGMLDSNALNKSLPIFFDNIKRANIGEANEKIAIAHIFRIHHLILNQLSERDAGSEDIFEVNQSRRVLNDFNFASMSQLLAIYQECLPNFPEAEIQQRCAAASANVIHILSTPYVADISQSEGLFSLVSAWLSSSTGNNKVNTGKVMESMGQKYK